MILAVILAVEWGDTRRAAHHLNRQTGAVRQRIKFCATPAGRVAYSVMGTGPILLCDTGWVSDLEKMLEIESFRAFFAPLADRFTVVRYDKAGCGLSDRTGVDLTFEGQVAAMVAVADALSAAKFHLFGASQGGQVAVAVAARQPRLIGKVVLYGTCARGADLAPPEVRESLLSLVRAHWGLGSQTLTNIFVPDASAEDSKDLLVLRSSATADVAADMLAEYYRTDVSSSLAKITAPTLVLHRDGDRSTRFGLGREVASLIPNGTFAPLRGTAHLFWKGDTKAIVDSMLDFLATPDSEEVALTRRELEVASLVAEGLTNQEIAQRLKVAHRTAETHVENIRQKLGFRSRAQIATWVTARGSASLRS